MSDYIGVVTNTGQAKIAAAIGGTALNLTTIRVGDGNGAPITPNAAMADLVRRVGAAYPIISSGRDPVNANHWRVTALIPVDDGPFDIREIGVWDAAGDMIAIARHVLVEKRTPAQGAAVELLTDIVFPVSETAQVTVQVTPSAQISIFQMLRAGFTVVESATLANPPGAPTLGRTHVVPAGATGAWVGLAGYLVQWNGIAWVGVNVPVGFHVVDQSKGIDIGARWLERTATGWAPGVSRLVQKQPGNYLAVVGGTANALTAILDPAITSYADIIGTPLRGMIATTNTGAATINLNGLGAKTILAPGGAALRAGDLPAGRIVTLEYDGADFVIAGAFVGGRGVQVFLNSGSFTVPAGVTSIRCRIWGGGGGGGGGNASGAGGGGAGGGYSEKVISVTPGQIIPVTIGNGGSGGGGGGNGGTGGTTSIGAFFSATGGWYGQGVGAGLAGGQPTVGGGVGGNINFSGYPGLGANGPFSGAYFGGAGGGAFGSSQVAPPISATGASGNGGAFPAGGGSGGAVSAGGGAGANGLAIIEW